MNTTVRETGPFERSVVFEITDAEIDAAKNGAARRLSQDLKLKGFRPGKAPRPVVEAAVGASRLRSEAIEDAIGPRLATVLREEEIAPAVNPQLENMEDVDNGVSVEVKVTLWPTLATPVAFQDRTIELDSLDVTDEELDEQLVRMREQYGQVEEVERAAGDGDFVSVDLSAELNGVAIEDAVATELLYRIGSAGLIEGADEALLGAGAGDEVTLESALPEGFGESGGELATFKIKINEVKELVLPEMDDEWVDENTEFDTVVELKTRLRQQMESMKRSTMSRRFADRALETLIEQVDVEIPEGLRRAEMDEILHRFVHRLEQQEVTLDQYFEVSGVSRDQFLGDLENQADHSIKTRLVLDSIVEVAELTVDESEVDAVLQQVATSTDDPMKFLAAARGSEQELALRSDMLRDKAIETIMANARPVDGDGNSLDLDPEVDEDDIVEGEIVEGEVLEADEVIAVGEVVDATVADEASDEENE